MNRAQEYKYLRSKAKHFAALAMRRKKYLEPILIALKPKRILELGCGEGSLGQLLKEMTGAQIFGVDKSASGISLAKEKGIIAERADLSKGIPFDDNYFDLVISDQLIEHINNTDLLVQESFRVLKKRGYLITITPNLSYWFNRLLFIIGIYPVFLEASLNDKTLGQRILKRFIVEKDVVGHIRVFNLPALLDLLTDCGFVVKKKQGMPWAFGCKSRLTYIYNLLDILFSKRVSLARDLMVIASKR